MSDLIKINLIKTRFDHLWARKNNIFMPFFTLGDPDFERSFDLISSAIDAGADCLELGIPFSDPIADGPVNQRSMARALSSGMNFDQALELIKKIRDYAIDIPIGLLLYYRDLSPWIGSIYKITFRGRCRCDSMWRFAHRRRPCV